MRSSSGGAIEYLPPREDVNSPDMYIPVMAFVTYILLSTLIAGLNGKFEPQLLGITFTNASFIILLELIVLWGGRYFLNISSESQIYDLVAYSGYKFVGVIVTIALAAIFNGGKGTGGWLGWTVFGYTFFANAFFLVSFNLTFCLSSGKPLTDALLVASIPQIRPPPLGQCSRQPHRADHRPLTTLAADAIPLRLQLCRAVWVHVVAQLSRPEPGQKGRQVIVIDWCWEGVTTTSCVQAETGTKGDINTKSIDNKQNEKVHNPQVCGIATRKPEQILTFIGQAFCFTINH